MNLQHHVHVDVHRGHVVHRRHFLQVAGLGALSAGLCGWAPVVQAQAAELRRRGMACILLWMQGGPSQFETFSPKPGHENGGETRAIATSVPGLEFSENLPHLAKVADHLAVIRSMTSREGSHPRATSYLHTGYLPTASVRYPALGAILAREIPDPECEVPAFVKVGATRGLVDDGAGFLGAAFDPFVVSQAGRVPNNSQPTTPADRYRRRLGLLGRLEGNFGNQVPQAVEDHRALYDQTARMVLSPQMQAFNLQEEPANVRSAYGGGNFASGCLLARRLVERGVTFVEVQSSGWDTHDNNFQRSRQLSSQIDQPMAQLLTDLNARGLLERTLVIWMGEFGRTPRINPRSGRDHYPRAFTVALAGAGIRGGQALGQTDNSGASVTERPVQVPDLFQTICHALKVDANKENMSSIGRPIRIVDGGQPVMELFG